MTRPRSIVTGILIGGKSRRMGTDKALLPWRGRTLVETVYAAARAVSDQVVLLGTGKQLPESLTGLPRLLDAHENAGPIAGLATLLGHFPRRWCLLLSCDLPRVTADVLNHLMVHVTPETDLVVYQVGDHIEPCCALYHARLLGSVTSAIERGDYSLHKLIAAAAHTLVHADPAVRDALLNVNTPDDYAGHLPSDC